MGKRARRREQLLPGLRAVRLRRLLSVTELAAALGTEGRTIHQYEDGLRGAQVRTIRRLVEALGCSVDELVGTAEREGRPT